MWRRLPAALSLFLLSPLIAEYLLGSLPVSMLGILPLMAMMYGSGAILIREIVRRTGRGWPSMALLACAYGFIEEGFTTQSLFNPNYLGLRLIDFGFVPLLGTALPWLIFVISIHVIWSICVPVGLTEVLFKGKRDKAWLGPVGIAAFSLLYVAGCVLVAIFTYKQRPFMATPAQLVGVGVIVAALVAGALLWPKPATGQVAAPHPVVLFLAAFVPGSLLMLLQQFAQSKLHWDWPVCVAAVLAIEGLFIAWMVTATRGKAWNDVQRFALMAGGFMTYVWVGFLTDAQLHGAAGMTAHAVLATVMCAVLAFAGYRGLTATD